MQGGRSSVEALGKKGRRWTESALCAGLQAAATGAPRISIA